LTNADELLRGGDLTGARKALVEAVRARPDDEQARMFLFQLLAVLGEWEKAHTQLNALAQLSPEAQMLSVAYGQAIEAEKLRARFFASGGEAHIHGGATGWPVDLARALSLFGTGDRDEALRLREQAFSAIPDTPGEIDGVRFEWLADADARFGPTLEAIIGGRWGLVPLDAVTKITSAGVRDLRDVVWYPVQIMFRSGQSVAAMVPARYPFAATGGTDAERLARATNWSSGPAGDVGSGQRLLSLSTGADVDILSLRSLVFD
jgi:type VI secretion system protein ImpE